MKVISLWQPWASLVAMNYKKIETRSWKAPEYLIGQRIAIHATKSMPRWVKELLRGFTKLLGIKEYNGSWLYNLERGIGHFGKVVATAKLRKCLKIVKNIGDSAYFEDSSWVCGNEYYFGDYTPGRFAWILEDIQPLKEPIPARGMQGIWEWKEGDSLASDH
jgi:hypothetical protein